MGKRTVEAVERMLRLLGLLDGEKTITQLARETGWRPNTVAEYIRDMELLGWVEVVEEPGAPPRKKPRPTPRGMCILECTRRSEKRNSTTAL